MNQAALLSPQMRSNFRRLYADIFWYGVAAGDRPAHMAWHNWVAPSSFLPAQARCLGGCRQRTPLLQAQGLGPALRVNARSQE